MMFLTEFTISTYFAWLVLSTHAIDYNNEYGDDYGVEWVWYITEGGTKRMSNFSTLPADTSGFILGHVYFYLYTRQNRDEPEELKIPENECSFNSTNFNPSNGIKVITHGWTSSSKAEYLQNMIADYLTKDDYNVIAVDWHEIAINPSYVWPALSTRYVGKRTAKLMDTLVQTYGVEGRNIHLIGHSLGAHVMGYAGSFSKERISRITGLDPARPLFEMPSMPDNYRLEKSDAEFVDIIHTAGGVFGYLRSHGHADFYPNNGRPRQPGCEGPQAMFEACSHGRATEFYVSSIMSEVPFTSYPCDSWDKFEKGNCISNSTSMGEPVSTDSAGDYYLHTDSASPYAKGDTENQTSD